MIQEQLKEIYIKYFKNSKIDVITMSNNKYYIRLLLAQNEREEINGYFDNDMFNINFRLYVNGENDFTLENVISRYFVKPTNQYLVYESKKVSFRKTKGNKDKILQSFEKYVQKLYTELTEDLKSGNIHNNHIELLTKKL